jgi:metal-sulfur cluster biosynthetic enzyme
VNAVAPALTVLVIVTVSVPEFVVICIPVPPANVRVSVDVSATTSLCPATAMVLKLFAAAPPVAAIVTVSVAASVVMVIFDPATKVRVSVAESATTELCPATAIVAKLSEADPPDTVAQVLSPRR